MLSYKTHLAHQACPIAFAEYHLLSHFTLPALFNMGAPNLYHSILVSLLWASVWFNSLARADYNRLCPNKAGQIQVDSTFYTVTCDTSYISPAPKKVKEGGSPEDCARLCTA